MATLLTKLNKPANRQPTRIAVPTFGVDVLVRPMSASRQFSLDLAHKFGEDGKSEKPAEYLAAVVADSVVDEAGELVFTADELLAEGFDFAVFSELASLVTAFVKGPKELPAKN